MSAAERTPAHADVFEAGWRECLVQVRAALGRSGLTTGEVRAAVLDAENVMREATVIVRGGGS